MTCRIEQENIELRKEIDRLKQQHQEDLAKIRELLLDKHLS